MNIKEFAKIIGVSTATVSRAFSTKGRISEETRQMIRSKAEELGYRANVYAKNLTSRSSNTLGFFYPSISTREPDYFMTEIMLGVNETAQLQKKILQVHPIHDSRENIETYKDYILDGSLAGIIVVAGTKISKELVETAKSANMPYIVIGYMSSEKKHAVTFSITHGVTLAAKYFHKIGRKQPAYVGGVNDRRKREGFTMALDGMADKLVCDPGGGTLQDGVSAFDRLMAKNSNIDCVLCANDVLAIGFIKAALNKNVKIPEDIAVIGCDDISLSRYYTPALTSIAFHEFAIGEKAVLQLCKLINKEEIYQESIQCDLVVRDSA